MHVLRRDEKNIHSCYILTHLFLVQGEPADRSFGCRCFLFMKPGAFATRPFQPSSNQQSCRAGACRLQLLLGSGITAPREFPPDLGVHKADTHTHTKKKKNTNTHTHKMLLRGVPNICSPQKDHFPVKKYATHTNTFRRVHSSMKRCWGLGGAQFSRITIGLEFLCADPYSESVKHCGVEYG